MNTDGLLWHYDINMIHKILRYLCIYASMHHYPILYWFIRYSLSDGIILSACWSIRLVAPLGHTEGDSPQKKLNLLVNFGIYPLEKHSHRTWPIYRWFIMIYLSISLISWWFSGRGSPDINHCPLISTVVLLDTLRLRLMLQHWCEQTGAACFWWMRGRIPQRWSPRSEIFWPIAMWREARWHLLNSQIWRRNSKLCRFREIFPKCSKWV